MSELIEMTAIIDAKEGCADILAEALPEFERLSNDEAGCIEFRFFREEGDGRRFVLWERFVNQEALTAHMQMAHTRALFGQGLIEKTSVIKHHRVT
ncbi:putative quinol monooxygenase [Neptuniibacter halophilus]|uniref:putative quinol monooxygenase n=1 Tax=Neptuniibacter halophilus TaxID=651666 RepID=UPI002573AFFC|nr:antibiotic biosynthesis monooxygenase [Neptuniibacter halophilus]